MNIIASLRFASLLLGFSIVSACSTTKPLGEWQNQGFTGHVDNILIIGVTSRSTRRRVFEDNFVEALSAHDVNSVPSYTLITSSVKLSRESVEQAVRQQGLEAVLVTRLVGVKQEQTYRLPPDYDYYRSFQGYYDHAWQQTSTGYYSQYRVLTLETNLFDVASGDLIWSMQSQVMDATQPRHIIEDQINLTIDTLVERGLIGPGQ